LAAVGLSLGASEAWADRLYIPDRKGVLLFEEEELDAVEAAQVSSCPKKGEREGEAYWLGARACCRAAFRSRMNAPLSMPLYFS
jgi:hypothetical protein